MFSLSTDGRARWARARALALRLARWQLVLSEPIGADGSDGELALGRCASGRCRRASSLPSLFACVHSRCTNAECARPHSVGHAINGTVAHRGTAASRDWSSCWVRLLWPHRSTCISAHRTGSSSLPKDSRSLTGTRDGVTSLASAAGTGRYQASVYPRAFSSRLSTLVLQCARHSFLVRPRDRLPVCFATALLTAARALSRTASLCLSLPLSASRCLPTAADLRLRSACAYGFDQPLGVTLTKRRSDR